MKWSVDRNQYALYCSPSKCWSPRDTEEFTSFLDALGPRSNRAYRLSIDYPRSCGDLFPSKAKRPRAARQETNKSGYPILKNIADPPGSIAAMNPYTQNNANAKKTVAAVIRISVGILDASTAHATAEMMTAKPISNSTTEVVGMTLNA